MGGASGTELTLATHIGPLTAVTPRAEAVGLEVGTVAPISTKQIPRERGVQRGTERDRTISVEVKIFVKFDRYAVKLDVSLPEV